MRHQGRLSKWNDDKGFGFITPRGGGEQVFVHIKSFANRQRRPVGNDIVTYEVSSDEKGRTRAERVAFIGESTQPVGTGKRILAFPALFLLSVTALAFAGKLPLAVPGLYLIASAVAFGFYAHDKSKARNSQWRTPENALHVLSVAGGWPGAFFAQELLRHKSRKQSFQIVFWATIIANCLGLAWLLSPSGAGVRAIFGI